MKRTIFILLSFMFALPALARHVAGGELFYEYLGPGASFNSSQYRITLRLFRDCNSSGPLLENEQVAVGAYEGSSLVKIIPLPLIGPVTTISLNTNAFPCLIGTVSVCYEVGIYSAITDLVDNTFGYTLARNGCCRIDNISNLSQPLNVGSTYVTRIPGTNTLPTGHNSSPQFNVKDTALVCSNKKFSLDFGAIDPDNDSLTFAFCDAYTAPNGANNAPPTPTLSLVTLPYNSPFSGSNPLGSAVQINPATGIISGLAPGIEGQYVVNVCITEWRKGKAFTEHRKDFILKVQACDIAQAALPDKIIQCDTFSVSFENQSSSSAITSYLWNFGESGSPTNISTGPTPTHLYADTGRYKASLTITGPNGCVGSDTTLVIVYPGFFPAFGVIGSCYQTPFHFADSTKTKYGVVNSWLWTFDDANSADPTSTIKNPTHKYGSAGIRHVQLFVTNSKGCEKTITQDVTVREKPLIGLPFRDTLICSIDTLPLIANGIGSFVWTPKQFIINDSTATPLVFPKDTITYYVTLNDAGCVNIDSIKVNVLDSITVNLGNDSSICKTDAFNLHPVSDALGYHWIASTGEIVQPVKYPLVQPLSLTQYKVIANLGKCLATDSVLIKPVPYPVANAGVDTVICFGTKAFLHGSMIASSFAWSPLSSLINANTLNPTAGPSKTMDYLLTVTDVLGCPKPVTDTVTVIVIPPVVVFAGNDTVVILNQPLQLNAYTAFDNSTVYLWTPSAGLSNPHIPNPIATLNTSADSVKYKVRATLPEGCYGEDEITIRVFKTGVDIFVPTAFTPNHDGRNDIFKPIPVGITKLDYFRIYNRWGELIFTTSETGKGWDGSFGGKEQVSGTYVYMVQGTDFTGKTVFRKGTFVLIR